MCPDPLKPFIHSVVWESHCKKYGILKSQLLLRAAGSGSAFLKKSSDDSVNRFFLGGGLFAISWATLVAHGGSQAGVQIGAVATGLRNTGSELRLQPTPQLMATPDP